MIIKCKNVEETYLLANKIAQYIQGGDIILLNGDLGAGKTTFVKGFAKAIGIHEVISSPTFNLLKTYQSEKYCLVHIDAYRLEGTAFEEIDDYVNKDNVLMIEWSECLSNQELLQNHLSITIKYISKNQRLFTLKAFGERYASLLREFSEHE